MPETTKDPPMSHFPSRPYNVAVMGAASGIGEAAARFLAAEGARVACLDANEAGAAAVANSLSGKGGESFAAKADVTDVASIESAIAGTAKAFGQIHALVNCAGI